MECRVSKKGIDKVNIKDEKTALITGATSGIGEAFARKFASEGYNLIITGRREEKLNLLATKLKNEFHVNVDTIIIELSDLEKVDMMIERIKDKFISVLVNNAGFGTKDLFINEDFEVQQQMVNVHVLCSMKLIYALLPRMVENDNGLIINLSSQSAFLPIKRNATYSGTKAFLKVFSEVIHLETMNTNVKIQVLCPGFVRSDFHEKMGSTRSKKNKGIFVRWMTPEQVVNISLRDIKKDKLVCKPGFFENLGMNLLTLLPKSIYYKMALKF